MVALTVYQLFFYLSLKFSMFSSWRTPYLYLQSVIHYLRHISTTSTKHIPVKIKHSCQLVPVMNLLGLYGPVQSEKINKYWTAQSYYQLLAEADRLYSEAKYLDIYEMLNRIQFYQNVEIQWRICRALYQMSRDSALTSNVRRNMLTEAHELIAQTLELAEGHPEVHKWMAIVSDARAVLDGTLARLKMAPQVKYHMLKSLDLNPDDPVVLYFLGWWCYTVTELNWIQKCLVKLLVDVPEVRTDEAYHYFLRAEQVQPRFFLGNIYMLGRCCYDMGHYYRARYYFTLASDLPVHSETERVYRQQAKVFAEKLSEYDVHLYYVDD